MRRSFPEIYMDVVGRRPILVACLALGLGGAHVLLGERLAMRGTVISERFNARGFAALRQGMAEAEVERLLGPPLRKVRGDEGMGAVKGETWHYTDPTGALMARFTRRWVHLTGGKLDRILE